MDYEQAQELKDHVAEELRASDIVWPKYGTTTIETLAEGIVNRTVAYLERQEHTE